MPIKPSGSRRPRISAKAAGFWLTAMLALVLGFGAYRVRSFQSPEPPAQWLDTGGLGIGFRVLGDATAARRAFGVDLYGAGLLPVRLDLRNQAGEAATIRPERSFLVDGQHQARPPLTAQEAGRRLAAAGLAGHFTPAKAEEAEPLATTLAGFALDLVRRPAEAPPFNEKTGLSLWLAAILGLDPHPLETRMRRDLAVRLPANPPLLAGTAAEGYLFFPAPAGSGGAAELRLALERAGRVEILRLPVAATETGGQP